LATPAFALAFKNYVLPVLVCAVVEIWRVRLKQLRSVAVPIKAIDGKRG